MKKVSGTCVVSADDIDQKKIEKYKQIISKHGFELDCEIDCEIEAYLYPTERATMWEPGSPAYLDDIIIYYKDDDFTEILSKKSLNGYEDNLIDELREE
jgi:hypothetical protein